MALRLLLPLNGLEVLSFEGFSGFADDILTTTRLPFAESTSLDSDAADDILTGDLTTLTIANGSPLAIVTSLEYLIGPARVNVVLEDTPGNGSYELNLIMLKPKTSFVLLSDNTLDEMRLIFTQRRRGDIFSASICSEQDGEIMQRSSGI